MIRWAQKLNRPPAEDPERVSRLNYGLRPRQQRMFRPALRIHVDGLISVNGIRNQRRVQAFRIGGGKSGVPASVPLHRRSNAIAVAEVDVVSHPDFVAIVDDRRSW